MSYRYIGHFTQPDELAASVALLVSADSSFLTAAQFLADGGITEAYVGPPQIIRLARIKSGSRTPAECSPGDPLFRRTSRCIGATIQNYRQPYPAKPC